MKGWMLLEVIAECLRHETIEGWRWNTCMYILVEEKMFYGK